jgi:hypothetical protein
MTDGAAWPRADRAVPRPPSRVSAYEDLEDSRDWLVKTVAAVPVPPQPGP